MRRADLPAGMVVEVSYARHAALRVLHHHDLAGHRRVAPQHRHLAASINFLSQKAGVGRGVQQPWFLWSKCQWKAIYLTERSLSASLTRGFSLRSLVACLRWVMKSTPSLFIGVCGVFVNSRLFSQIWVVVRELVVPALWVIIEYLGFVSNYRKCS